MLTHLLPWKHHKLLADIALLIITVHPLQIEVGELKGRLTEVISNCDALCKRIAAEGPESLRSSVEPFTTGRAEAEGSGSLDSKQEP
jgi:hypothetical protein